MKVKPKEVMLNLPIALLFSTQDEVAQFAANINTLIHGKVKVKVEDVGVLGGQYVSIFYLQRNNEYSELREEFIKLIENEEMNNETFHTPDVEPEDWEL
jgi:hypothetical protein